jgi:methylglutaconyl-CoA hydratase
MLFTGALYKADYIGRFKGSLFNHVLPTPEGTYEKCVELAKTIARNGPIGVQAAKACANESFGLEPAEGDMITEKHYTITLKTQDRIRALEAVANKEVPVFIGN